MHAAIRILTEEVRWLRHARDEARRERDDLGHESMQWDVHHAVVLAFDRELSEVRGALQQLRLLRHRRSPRVARTLARALEQRA